MKKIIIGIGLASAVALSSYAQGTVNFANNNGTKISTNSVVGGASTGVTGAWTPSGQNYYFALFYSTTATSVGGVTSAVLGNNGVYAFNSGAWSYGGLTATNTVAGKLQSSTLNPDNSSSVVGLGAGSSASFVLIGWSSNIGSSWTALQTYLANPTFTGLVGESVVTPSIQTGILGSTPAASIFGPTGITAFTLGEVSPVVVPEPGTLALMALGSASLLLFRRKK
jgi:hypothetical protein